MKNSTEELLNRILLAAVVVSLVWIAWVIVDTEKYRREMACRDGWHADKGLTAKQCQEILRDAPPPSLKGAPKL